MIFREMYIEMRFPLPFIILVKKTSDDTEYWKEYGENGSLTLLVVVWNNHFGGSYTNGSMQILQLRNSASAYYSSYFLHVCM